MDASTEEALKAIITAIAASEVSGRNLLDEVAHSLAVSSSLSRDTNDPVTAEDLSRLSRWAVRKGD